MMGGYQVMTVWGGLGGRRRVSALSCTLFLGVSVCISGCSTGYEDVYVLEERIPTLDEGAVPARFADAFASNLYVVTDRSGLDADFATSEATALFDVSDREILYSREAFKELYPASVTKVMTALVAIKEGDLNSRIHVTGDTVITKSGTTLYDIEPGNTLILEQLFYDLMLPSGNDVGAAIAIHIAGSIDAFTDMMNEETLRLGAIGTRFVSPHGLNDPGHYMTAYDLYLIFNEALKYPAFHRVMDTTAYTTNYHNKDSEPVTKTWKGRNWFMTGGRETPDDLEAFGGKTSTTEATGYCLIMASRDDSDKEYISVVLKADNRPHLYDNMANIISKIVR